MPSDAAAEKPGSAKNGNGAIVHGRRSSNSSTHARPYCSDRSGPPLRAVLTLCKATTSKAAQDRIGARPCHRLASHGLCRRRLLRRVLRLRVSGVERLWSRRHVDSFSDDGDILESDGVVRRGIAPIENAPGWVEAIDFRVGGAALSD